MKRARVAKEKSEAARELGKLGAAKGGRARANVLTQGERQEIARHAARARWNKDDEQPAEIQEPEVVEPLTSDVPYSMFRGTLTIGDVEIECHVLSDHRRVLTQREMVRVISGGRESSTIGRYLERHPLYGPERIEGRVIPFKQPGLAQLSHGYEATSSWRFATATCRPASRAC
jgi:hypothetical protein